MGGLCLAMVFACAPLTAQTSAASERRTVDRAERLRDSGRPEEAAQTLEGHLARAPDALSALALLGELSMEGGRGPQFLPFAESAALALPSEDEAQRWWVWALLATSQADSARAVSERWIERSPTSGVARVAQSEVWLALGDANRAIQSLAQAPVPRAPDLLVRLADLLVREGRSDVVSTWVEMLAVDPPLVGEVAASLTEAASAGVADFGRLADALGAAERPERRSGARVALRLGDADAARDLADGARGAGDAEDAAFLREYVRAADDADLPGEVAWAAEHLVRLSARPVDRLRWQALAADNALAAGDSAGARRAFIDLSRESTPGDSPHQIASQRLFALLAADPNSLDEAEGVLQRYAAQYPDSSRAEADMYGQLALGRARTGDLAAAEQELQSARREVPIAASGPLDAAAAQLSLFAGARDSALARSSRSVNEIGLAPAARTERLRLLTLVQVADSSEIAVAGPALHALNIAPESFDPGPILRELAGLAGTQGRPTLLAHVADAAGTAGREELAADLRQRIVDRYPASPEAPPALLALARAAGPNEAVAWLERLVVGYPDSALAPVARRMLTDLAGSEQSP